MEKELSSEFLRVMGKFQKLKYMEQTRINRGEYRMLFAISDYLERNEGKDSKIKISDLAEHMYATKPAVSKMLNVLEQKGMIKRIMDKEDRRVVYVKLTKSGECCINEGKQMLEGFTIRIIEKLGEKEVKTLIKIMEHMYNIVLEEFESIGKSKGEQ